MSVSLPSKSLFKADEVCTLTGIRPYVLRFWETEFSEIHPLLSDSGQKLYEAKDIELISFIKKLLFDEKLTVNRAKMQVYEFWMKRESERRQRLSVEDKEIKDDEEMQELVISASQAKWELARSKLQFVLQKTESIQVHYAWK